MTASSVIASARVAPSSSASLPAKRWANACARVSASSSRRSTPCSPSPARSGSRSQAASASSWSAGSSGPGFFDAVAIAPAAYCGGSRAQESRAQEAGRRDRCDHVRPMTEQLVGNGAKPGDRATRSVVAAHEVTRRYGEDATAVDALRGVSLDVRPGEVVAVMGPSGSGKSTLMHTLAGLDKPTSGSVEIGGEEITGMDDAKLTQ